MSSVLRVDAKSASLPDAKGRFGEFGGRYVPETLVPALDRLQAGVDRYLHQAEFQAEFCRELNDLGGPAHGAVACAGFEQALGCAGLAEARGPCAYRRA